MDTASRFDSFEHFAEYIVGIGFTPEQREIIEKRRRNLLLVDEYRAAASDYQEMAQRIQEELALETQYCYQFSEDVPVDAFRAVKAAMRLA